MPMNWFMALKVVCCAPVAVSPEACVRAPIKGVPANANSGLKPPGSAAPDISGASIPAATFRTLTLALAGSVYDSSPGSSVSSTSLPA
ncbi:hypothetical protein [Bradyrhizobium ottawaense]|uniref:hypothetical protein n=1 Tax=Bradyrhizobium ottawaense TaxID=931866 RepID=UPI00351726BA